MLYSSNAEQATTKIQQAAEKVTHHQLQWIVNEDPEWLVFNDFVAR